MSNRAAPRTVSILFEVDGVIMIEPIPEHHELVGDCTKISVGVSSAGIELFSMPCTLSSSQAIELIEALNLSLIELAKRQNVTA